jgi:predicted ATPase
MLDGVGKGDSHNDLRCRLGWFLHANSSLYGKDIMFAAADNLNYGKSQVRESQRIDVAKVNLAAGIASKKKAAFISAAEYANEGLVVLGSTLPWQSQYDLVLGLASLLAESKYCLGEFPDSMRMVNEILHNARDGLDKVPAHMVSIDTIAALGKLNQLYRSALRWSESWATPFQGDQIC